VPTADTERCEPCAARQAPVCTRAAMQPCRHGRVDPGPQQLWTWCTLGLRLEKRNSQGWHYKHTASRSLLYNSHLSLTASRIIHSQTICIHRGLLCTGSHLYEASVLTGLSYQPLRPPQSPQRKRKKETKRRASRSCCSQPCSDR